WNSCVNEVLVMCSLDRPDSRNGFFEKFPFALGEILLLFPRLVLALDAVWSWLLAIMRCSDLRGEIRRIRHALRQIAKARDGNSGGNDPSCAFIFLLTCCVGRAPSWSSVIGEISDWPSVWRHRGWRFFVLPR
ncbi:MAG: hypothetical protein ACO3RV_02015, partial [Luteolibacter sp.]